MSASPYVPRLDAREMRGQFLAQQFGWVRRVDEHTYMVHSQRLDKEYRVEQTETGWVCECPDASFRLQKCKHVWAVEISWTLRRKAQEALVISPVKADNCPKCGGTSIVRHGLRHNKCGDLQRFSCHECGTRFTVNLGFERMKATPETVSMAMQMYFSGMSFEFTAKALRLKGVKISGVGVYKWTKKYVKVMKRFVEEITPKVGDNWRTDEMYVKIRGNMRYLFGMMDDETRFRIAQQVAEHKGTSDVRPMFREALRRTGKKPKVLISDGAHNFHRAYNKEYWTHNLPRPIHVKDIRLGGKVHNNKMERQNGEWRDREKVMRGLKREDSPVLDGMQIFHNFIREHEGLGGRTPAEAAGIKVEGENKWLTLIQNASKASKPERDSGSQVSQL